MIANTKSLVAATIASKATQMAFLLILISELDQSAFALYILFLTYSEIFSMIILHGVQSAILKSVLREKIKKSIFHAYVSIFGIFFMLYIITPSRLEINNVYWILFNSIVASLSTFQRNVLVTLQAYRRYALLLYSSAVPFWVFLILAVNLDLKLEMVFITISISNLICFVVGMVKFEISPNKRYYISAVFPFFVRNTIGLSTRNFGIVSVDHLFTGISVAGFGSIMKVAEQASQFLNLITIQLIPYLRDRLNNGSKIVREVLLLSSVAVAIGVVCSVMIIAGFKIANYFNFQHWILEERFTCLMVLWAVLVGFVKSNLSVWEYVDEQKLTQKFIFIEIALFSCAVATNLHFITIFGADGLALSYFILQVIALGIHAVFLVRYNHARQL